MHLLKKNKIISSLLIFIILIGTCCFLFYQFFVPKSKVYCSDNPKADGCILDDKQLDIALKEFKMKLPKNALENKNEEYKEAVGIVKKLIDNKNNYDKVLYKQVEIKAFLASLPNNDELLNIFEIIVQRIPFDMMPHEEKHKLWDQN